MLKKFKDCSDKKGAGKNYIWAPSTIEDSQCFLLFVAICHFTDLQHRHHKGREESGKQK